MPEWFREERHVPHSKEWHLCRADGVCGSDVPIIMGRPTTQNYGSVFDLYYEKVYRDAFMYDDSGDADSWAWWGTELEPIVRNRFARDHPEFGVAPSGTCIRLGAEWRRANPDGWVFDGPKLGDPVAGLEVKCVDSRMAEHWGDALTQGIAQGYYDQVQWAMDVTGIGVWFVAALFGGNTYREFEVTYDPEYAAVLRAEAQAFWRSVLDRQQPDPDERPATLQRLKRLHPEVEDFDVTVSDDIAEGFRRAAEFKRAGEAAYKLASNRLRAELGSGKRALDGYGKLVASRSVYERDAYEVAATTVDKLNPGRQSKKRSNDDD